MYRIGEHIKTNDRQPAAVAQRAHAVYIEDNRPQTAIQKKQLSNMQHSAPIQMVRKKGVPRRRLPEEQGTEMIFSRNMPQPQAQQQEQPQESPIDIEKIRHFIRQYKKMEQTFRHRKEGQRIEVHNSGNSNLKGMLKARREKKKRKKAGVKQYLDPSYHETVQYMDSEYAEFYNAAQGILTPEEIAIGFDMLMQQHNTTVDDNTITSSGAFPLSGMTPSLMEMYHESHYKKELQKPNDSVSSRAYESDYITESSTRVPFSQWRPMVLPEQDSSHEHTMVDAIGGTLDANVPTVGKTIGQGKVYSAIYKHFQRTMEIINILLDEEHGEYQSGNDRSFMERTHLHTRHLEANLFMGMHANEEERFDAKDSGFDSWNSLSGAIDELIVLISASLDDVPEDMMHMAATRIDLGAMLKDPKTFVKKFELIGTIIGLMIKKEKRLVLNYQMLGKPKGVEECLNNLYELRRVELAINRQVAGLWHIIGPMISKKQESKQVGKELDDLNDYGEDEVDVEVGSKRQRASWLPPPSEYLSLDGIGIFDDVADPITAGRVAVLNTQQVNYLLEWFGDRAPGRTVTFNGMELRILHMKVQGTITPQNPTGMVLGLRPTYRGG